MEAIDSVDRELTGWLAAMPDVDPQVEAARQRIGRLSRLFARLLEDVAVTQRISLGDWEALSVLVRTGRPSTPTAIGEALGLTSGTVSTRLKRLASAGLIEVLSDADGRSRPVRLTPAGRRRWRAATAARVAAERELFGALSAPECKQLNATLSTLLAQYESRFGIASRHDVTHPNAATHGPGDRADDTEMMPDWTSG